MVHGVAMLDIWSTMSRSISILHQLVMLDFTLSLCEEPRLTKGSCHERDLYSRFSACEPSFLPSSYRLAAAWLPPGYCLLVK